MRVFHVLPFLVVLFAADAAQTRKSASAPLASDCDAKGCSHDCETVGEFPLCVCPPDMALDRDGRTCKDSTSILLAMFRGIKLYNEDTEETVSVAPGKARCLDYHYGRRELYIYTNYTIMRYPLSKGKTASPVSLVTRTDTSVTSLAVDWVHDVIYHISEQQLTVGVMSLEGGDPRTILAHKNNSSAGWQNLVVDPYAKKLFWIGSKGVYSSNLEGGDLVTEMMSWIEPDKITLNPSDQLIYAIGRRGESENKVITKANYNGTKVGEDVEVIHPATVGIFGFGVVGNTAYWESNFDGENLYKYDLQQAGKTNKVAATLVAEVNQIVYDMKIYHQEVQKAPK